MWSKTSSPAAVRKAGALFFLLFSPAVLSANSKSVYTNVAFDYPLDGGGMVMVSRMAALKPWLHVGAVLGGGVIHRDLEIDGLTAGSVTAETRATVAPFIGPQIGIYGDIIGISLSYGFYHAKTKFEIGGLASPLSSETSAWGQGFYSPLLTLDFYLKELDMVAGFGLGGFFGSHYPDLVADNGTVRAVSTDDPISTLTFHLHMRWASDRKTRAAEEDEL